MVRWVAVLLPVVVIVGILLMRHVAMDAMDAKVLVAVQLIWVVRLRVVVLMIVRLYRVGVIINYVNVIVVT